MLLARKERGIIFLPRAEDESSRFMPDTVMSNPERREFRPFPPCALHRRGGNGGNSLLSEYRQHIRRNAAAP
jgi:hypothetical protein